MQNFDVTDPVENLVSANQTLLGCLMGIAIDEVLNTKRRTKATMLHRAEQGYLMGKAPVGYLNKQINGHGVIVVDKEKAYFA